VPILPTLHGTDESVAWKICRSGFATLALLDAGWYGSGIYFTTDARYALPYFGTKQQPALLIALLIPGNIYPVTESHLTLSNSMVGKPIPGGYQSCYVHTQKSGFVCKVVEPEYYDEIVIAQETQVLPVFLLTIEAKSIVQQLHIWQRDILEPEAETDDNQELELDDSETRTSEIQYEGSTEAPYVSLETLREND